jgi:hypothetical protein
VNQRIFFAFGGDDRLHFSGVLVEATQLPAFAEDAWIDLPFRIAELAPDMTGTALVIKGAGDQSRPPRRRALLTGVDPETFTLWYGPS